MKILKNIFLIILILVLFISSCSLIILAPIKYAVNPDSINKVITNIDIETLIEENPEFQETINTTLEPLLSETEKLGINEEVIIKIINSKEIKGMMANVTSNLVDYALTGKKYELITVDQIKDLVSQAINIINQSGYYEINDKDKENILKIITDEKETIEEIIPDTDIIEENITKDYKDIVTLIRFIFSTELVIYLSLGLVVSLIDIILIKWKEFKWVKSSAITIMIASLVVLIFIAIIRLGSKIILKDDIYIYNIIKNISKYNLIFALIIFTITIVIIVTYSILHKKKKAIS